MPACDAWQALHDEKFAARDRQIAAQPQRFRRVQSGRVRELQDFKFVAASEARRDARRGVRAQYPLMRAGLRAAGHVGIERPVLLHRAAGKAVEMPDVHRVRAGGRPQERFEAGSGVGGVEISFFSSIRRASRREGDAVNYMCE